MKIAINTILLALVMTTTATAGWNELWGRVHLDYSRNKCWPSPFAEQDRASVHNYFSQMTAVGIRLQNTLGDQYFDPQTQQINLAGQRKIEQILTNTEDRRAIFVLQSLRQDATQARVESVRNTLAQMVGNPDATEIYVSPTKLIGRPADYIDDVYRRERASIPAPRLPESTE